MLAEGSVDLVGQICVQHDWYDALRLDSSKKFWVSFTREGEKTLYTDMEVSKEGDVLLCKDGDRFQGQVINKNVLKLSVDNTTAGDGSLTSYFFAPHNTYTDVHDKAVRCVDVSPSGGLAVSCGDDGGLYVWQTDDGTVRRVLEGHVMDPTTCAFFPSGMVVLSGGVDMRLKIWSVEDGSCPVTLSGHTGAITSTAIIDKGRNIVSTSRDGTARLWDCGTAQCLHKFDTHSGSVINNCRIAQYHSPGVNQDDGHEGITHERECGTRDKLLLLAREDGFLDGVDLYSKEEVFSVACHSAVNDCCFVSENHVVVGLEDGKDVYFDVRNTTSPTHILSHGRSPITCVREFPGESVLLGRGDGACSCVRTNTSTSRHGGVSDDVVTMELSGANCDPINSVTHHGNVVYTACRDGKLRKYKMQLTP